MREGRLLDGPAMLVLEQRRFEETRGLCDRALGAHRSTEDRHGEAVALNTWPTSP
ncbi:hypothetical protein LZG04_13210 [Saccharothrix sp. S26]|uniref:hypothetical protein n=1 Tax=Saccharothrix sp. S26 TaxID=2907215 RepID=UPI001F2B1C0C|nr:hypothetical protein [Saccharothrix sp. S26]MCE6995753.1 hypothetical protein [Saccharothrix sp. S26]